jgi:crotonobetainyl-CoA:carnitine CoA-transferase CaiB-like acyl-CoA transferase
MAEYKPFSDINVLDLTQSIAGPFSTQLLGTLGADVVKVEPPRGDAFRDLLDGAMFATVNLGEKRSLSLDLKSEEGQEAARSLAEEADVVIESFQPGTVEKFGLDYATVSSYNEDVVYVSLSGYGQDGPRSEWPAYDPAIQAVSGLMSTIGYQDRPPVRIGASVIDMGTGTLASFLITSALFNRKDTGEGQYFDVNLFEMAVAWMGYWIAYYTGTGETPTPSGQGFAGIAPNEVFDAGDGKPFYLAVVNDRFWKRMCSALEVEELADDPRFETNPDRWENRDELRETLRDVFEDYDRDELTQRLADANVPNAPLQYVDELVEKDSHVAARDMLTQSYNLMEEEEIKTANTPFKVNDERPDLNDRPPRVGEHTREVLAELGYSDKEIDAMIDAGAAVSD